MKQDLVAPRKFVTSAHEGLKTISTSLQVSQSLRLHWGKIPKKPKFTVCFSE